MKKIIVLIVIALSCGMLFGQKYSKKKDYSEGLAAVYFQERWGFVDENDKLVINYAFEDVRPFSNGVAQVKYQGNWIYIDKKGKVTNAPQIAQNNSSSSSNNKNSSSSSNKSSSSSNYNSSSNKNNPSNSSNKSSSSSSYNSSSSSSNNSSNSSSSSSNYQTSSNSSGNSNSSRQEQVGKYILFDDEPHTEKDGFCWIETSGKDMEAWNKGELRYVHGAKDKNGKVIIPLGDYDYVFYSNTDNDGYPPFFEVAKNECNGACTIDGREIIAPKYGKVHYDPDSDVFVFQEYAADPTKSENFMTILFDDSPWYSLGVSVNKKGEPYMSNKGIVPYSDYYTAPKTSNTYYSNSSSGSYSSSSSTPTAPILNADNLAKGIITVVAGAAIIKGIANLFKDSSSSSSSSGSSSSNNDKASSNSENVMSMGNVIITRADLYEHNVMTGKFDEIVMYMRNDNNHDVFVNVEMKVKGRWEPCRITYDDKAATEPLNGSYSDAGSREIHLKRNSTRVVEVTSYSSRRPDGIRITNVH